MLDYILKKLIRLYNSLMPKDSKSIVLTPHSNCSTDDYDLFNWESDNVLCLAKYILYDSSYRGYRFYIVYYNDDKLPKYNELANNIKDRQVIFVKDNTPAFVKAFVRSKIIINATTYRTYSYKVSSQKLICLGYYTPFKDDYGHILSMTERERELYSHNINQLFDYHITVSDFSSRIISSDFLMYYEHFKALGFPRNDIFYRYDSEKKKLLKEELSQQLGYDIKTIIVYTPTFRDYDNSSNESRSLFTETNEGWYKRLDTLLQKEDAVIIAKLHPLQEKDVIDNSIFSPRIIFFSELQTKITINLYKVLAISDLLITDYTSTCFDYLHTNEPIIFYWFDYSRYSKERGFCINPISDLSGGDIVYYPEELLESIRTHLEGNDKYMAKRQYVHNLINYEHDGFSTKRIADFILSLNEKNK